MILKLAVILVSRRAVTAVIFTEERLTHAQTRHLASDETRAVDSTIGFVRWVISKFDVNLVGLETDTTEDDRAGLLRARVLGTFRQEGTPIWEVGERELFAAFGLPPLRNRGELRAVIARLWPIVERENTGILDALGLGLYIQVERLFNN